ncbi:MAG: hypothetical protein A2939_05665 [Parcubacteria group bacterium RIFCSPLOWO2_01_FULL_48_18]|nr:MAG: hypothetical protein A2939_05665 [Parcubacteria group bacterium RIFCSPLOWO2_01_FULL_48_18]
MAKTKGGGGSSRDTQESHENLSKRLTEAATALKDGSLSEFLKDSLDVDAEDIAEFVEIMTKTTDVVRKLMPVAEMVWKLYRKDVTKILGLFGDVVNDISEDLHEKIVRGYNLSAKLKKSKYDALVKAGFAEAEAMQVLLAEIKPKDYSSLLKSVSSSASRK